MRRFTQQRTTENKTASTKQAMLNTVHKNNNARNVVDWDPRWNRHAAEPPASAYTHTHTCHNKIWFWTRHGKKASQKIHTVCGVCVYSRNQSIKILPRNKRQTYTHFTLLFVCCFFSRGEHRDSGKPFLCVHLLDWLRSSLFSLPSSFCHTTLLFNHKKWKSCSIRQSSSSSRFNSARNFNLYRFV